MTQSPRSRKIDTLMEQASKALVHGDVFKAEQLGVEALGLARQAGDFDRVARILRPLEEARRLRFQKALDLGSIQIVEEDVTESMKVDPGCYLIEPPRVGADARRLRLGGFEQGVPVAVVCREPITRLRECPVVAIAPGYSLRTRVDPPENLDEPDLAWFVGALEALAQQALDDLDPSLPPIRRLDALLLRLDALPESDRIHQLAAEAAEECLREAAAPVGPSSRRPVRTAIDAEAEPDADDAD